MLHVSTRKWYRKTIRKYNIFKKVLVFYKFLGQHVLETWHEMQAIKIFFENICDNEFQNGVKNGLKAWDDVGFRAISGDFVIFRGIWIKGFFWKWQFTMRNRSKRKLVVLTYCSCAQHFRCGMSQLFWWTRFWTFWTQSSSNFGGGHFFGASFENFVKELTFTKSSTT